MQGVAALLDYRHASVRKRGTFIHSVGLTERSIETITLPCCFRVFCCFLFNKIAGTVLYALQESLAFTGNLPGFLSLQVQDITPINLDCQMGGAI